MAKKKKKEGGLIKSPMSEELFDTNGVPMSAGNRKGRRAMAKGTSKAMQDAYNQEPIWQKMEKIMQTLKAWYALNMQWLQFDEQAKAVLNDMQKEHEEREQTIRREVAKALKREHEQLNNLKDHTLSSMLEENGGDLDEDKLEALLNVAFENEHQRLDEVFARVEDQKVLKNQLYSMQKEHQQLVKLSEIQTAKKKSEGKK